MPSLVYDLPPGTLINDRYKLLKALGQGGFGITYIAWDSELRRNVAVKECFPAGICLREQEGGGVRPIRSEWESMYLKALDDMRKEACTLAALDHKNIVRIHDVIWGNGSVFCVMPWLASGSLKSHMSDESLTAEKTIHWLRLLLDALEYLHSRGIIHRDLKPDNIMFDESGDPVIIDFGAALNRPELTTTTTQGSFSRGYAAPEQITGKGRVGPWTDFYALSATWYELLTGMRPEASDARLMQDDQPPLSSSNSRMSYPSELLALLQRNLSLKPLERCQSVEQWLHCWKSGTLPALPIPRHGLLKRRALAAAALAALAGGVGYTVWLLAPEERIVSPSSVDMDEVRARMSARLRTLCRVGEFVRLSEQAIEECDSITADHLARIDQFFNHVQHSMDSALRYEDLQPLEKSAYRDFNTLVNAFQQAANACFTSFTTKIKGFPTSESALGALIKPQNTEESVALLATSRDVAAEMQGWFDKVQIACVVTPENRLQAAYSRWSSLYASLSERLIQLEQASP